MADACSSANDSRNNQISELAVLIADCSPDAVTVTTDGIVSRGHECIKVAKSIGYESSQIEIEDDDSL